MRAKGWSIGEPGRVILNTIRKPPKIQNVIYRLESVNMPQCFIEMKQHSVVSVKCRSNYLHSLLRDFRDPNVFVQKMDKVPREFIRLLESKDKNKMIDNFVYLIAMAIIRIEK